MNVSARKPAVINAMGGPEKISKRQQAGLLDARSRIERLFDPGTFRQGLGVRTESAVYGPAVDSAP